MVKALEMERKNDDGKYEVVHTMKIKPPAGTFSRRLEKIMSGVLMQAADDVIIYEVGTDGKRLD
jgi:hypothetical protein